MNSVPRAAIDRPRRWLAICLGVCALTALAGCRNSPVADKAVSPTVSEPIVIASATASMSAPTATTKPPATKPAASPTPTSQATSASPSPSAATPTAASSTPSSSPSAVPSSSGTAACVTSAAQFNCGPFDYPQIEGTSSNPTVGNNVWSPIPGWQQTLYANNPGDWHVVADMPAGNTAVVSYPSSGSNFNNKPLSDFKKMYSSFSETMNATSRTSAWATYDIWLANSGKANEIMIQHDFANNGACGPDASATFNGQHWYLCNFGSMIAWKLPHNEQSGTVNILAMLTWLQDHGYISKSSELGLIGYGWEIASTGGRPETFTVSNYSITAS